MRISYLFFILILFSCSQNQQLPDLENAKFDDLVEVDQVSTVVVYNNNGTHEVKDTDELMEKIRNMTLVQSSFKVGSKSITLTIGGEQFVMLTNTRSNYFEVSSNIVTKNKKLVQGKDVLYFEATDFNIDNY